MGNTPYRADRRILEFTKHRQKINSKHTKQLNVFMVGLDGAGKSTILYKHLMGSTYSADSINIPQTITYNVETIRRSIRPHHVPPEHPVRPVPPVLPLNPIKSPSVRSRSKPSQKQIYCRSRAKHSAPLLLNIFDYGGKLSTRTLWTNYRHLNIGKLKKSGNRIDFFILVVDCTDFERLNDENDDCVQLALKELLNMKSCLQISLCIFANKQDVLNAITPSILSYRLGIKQITLWNLIANVKYTHDVCIPWKLSAKILSYLPNPNYHWEMTNRRWCIFGTETVSTYNKGIHDGIQWLYNEYDRQKQKPNNITKTKRFKLTV